MIEWLQRSLFAYFSLATLGRPLESALISFLLPGGGRGQVQDLFLVIIYRAFGLGHGAKSEKFAGIDKAPTSDGKLIHGDKKLLDCHGTSCYPSCSSSLSSVNHSVIKSLPAAPCRFVLSLRPPINKTKHLEKPTRS
jgi:hypothetical protein